MTDSYTLAISRIIPAAPARVFEAWTSPEKLRQWWGPAGVECSDAAVDLRVGGRYHLDNALPDGRVLRISGVFEAIEPPSRLVYSWQLGEGGAVERVTVRFCERDGGTEVTIEHERIATEAARDEHQRGWGGCLDGLVALVG